MDIVLSDVAVRIPSTGRLLFRIGHFNVPAGSHVLVHGASGIGKTTLLHLIAGLFLPESGTIRVGGIDLGSLSDAERGVFRRKHLGIIFQRLNLIEHLTVLENVALPLRRGTDVNGRSREALRRVNIESLGNEQARNLSLGEQQRTAAARVLAAAPDLILADEPTSSLDEYNAGAVLDALQGSAHGKTLVVVSHDRRIEDRFQSVFRFEEVVAS